MLFSEPKIPQCVRRNEKPHPLPEFQCSSASRKFLNYAVLKARVMLRGSFSALQRAENSSMLSPPDRNSASNAVSVLFSEPKIPQSGRVGHLTRFGVEFQCSSASRKFLNTHRDTRSGASSSVSVLFSEPKIPQCTAVGARAAIRALKFQCSSASRKFLNASPSPNTPVHAEFQCSSASRKFLNMKR